MSGVHEVVITHRIGTFSPGEETLLVAVGAEHRKKEDWEIFKRS
jgi:molybdopterin synthase catalytic subunit